VTIEKSHGKARPTLPRASDLVRIESDGHRTDGRDPLGRFAGGNRLSIGHGLKATLKKLLGPRVDAPEAKAIRRDAWRVFAGTMSAMVSDAPPVRALVSLYSGHVALAGYYRAKASAVGLDTPEGLRFLEVADRQSTRAERTIVTAHDLARVHVVKDTRAEDPTDLSTELAEVEAEEEAERAAHNP
jgi:hypothetical protein